MQPFSHRLGVYRQSCTGNRSNADLQGRSFSPLPTVLLLQHTQQVLSALAVSKLLLAEKSFGGLVLSYVATGQTTQLFALLAWQAWKKCVWDVLLVFCAIYS